MVIEIVFKRKKKQNGGREKKKKKHFGKIRLRTGQGRKIIISILHQSNYHQRVFDKP